MTHVLLVTMAVAGHGMGAVERSPMSAPKARARVFLLDAERLAETRRRLAEGDASLAPALERLRRDADRARKAGPFSVTSKTARPPSGDKHDYMSIGPYWWPNPNTKDHTPYVRRDGEVNPERGRLGDAARLGRMISAVDTLALAYHLTGRAPYADHAAKLIRTWFLDEATRMNPHMQYAQAIPGRCTGRGIGIVDTARLPAVVDAAGLLTGSKAWTGADEKALRAWFAAYLKWLLGSAHGRAESRAKNNHSTQYDVQVACYALYTNQPDIARGVLARVGSARIARQVQPDGRQPHELARTKAWSYSVANTRNLMNLARLGMHVGVDLWRYRSRDGRSIPKALEYLIPFATGSKTWSYKQITKFRGSSLSPLLRRALIRTRDERYGRALESVRGASASARDRLLSPLRPRTRTPAAQR